MPRVNPLRSLANERNLARRIQFERARRGMSYDGLAKRMAAAGVPIQSTAIFKIEKGDPPRRITVDELVGFAAVFDLTIDEMLLPMELVQNRRATELAEQYNRIADDLSDLFNELHGTFAEYFRMVREEPDDVRKHFQLLVFGPSPKLEADMAESAARIDRLPPGVAEAGRALLLAVMDAAATEVEHEVADEIAREKARKA